MNQSVQLLAADIHREHGFKPSGNYAFAAKAVCAPVQLNELSSAVASYSLMFIKYSTVDRFQLIVLLGLETGSNLFVDYRGNWMPGVYVPACFRCYPFIVKQLADEEPRRWAFGFNKESGLYRECPNQEAGDVRFFDEEGNVLPYLQDIINLCAVSTSQQGLTQFAVDALAASGLLEVWDFAKEAPDGKKPLIDGLYRINEQTLMSLDATKLKELQAVHALHLAYAQLLSTQRFKLLKKLYNARVSADVMPPNKAAVDMLFGEESTESFKFDWSQL